MGVTGDRLIIRLLLNGTTIKSCEIEYQHGEEVFRTMIQIGDLDRGSCRLLPTLPFLEQLYERLADPLADPKTVKVAELRGGPKSPAARLYDLRYAHPDWARRSYGNRLPLLIEAKGGGHNGGENVVRLSPVEGMQVECSCEVRTTPASNVPPRLSSPDRVRDIINIITTTIKPRTNTRRAPRTKIDPEVERETERQRARLLREKALFAHMNGDPSAAACDNREAAEIYAKFGKVIDEIYSLLYVIANLRLVIGSTFGIIWALERLAELLALQVLAQEALPPEVQREICSVLSTLYDYLVYTEDAICLALRSHELGGSDQEVRWLTDETRLAIIQCRTKAAGFDRLDKAVLQLCRVAPVEALNACAAGVALKAQRAGRTAAHEAFGDWMPRLEKATQWAQFMAYSGKAYLLYHDGRQRGWKDAAEQVRHLTKTCMFELPVFMQDLVFDKKRMIPREFDGLAFTDRNPDIMALLIRKLRPILQNSCGVKDTYDTY